MMCEWWSLRTRIPGASQGPWRLGQMSMSASTAIDPGFRRENGGECS